MPITNGDFKRNIVTQITADEGTAVTTVVNNLRSDSVVLLSLNTEQGSAPGQAYVSGKVPSTGVIEITSRTNDTSIYDVVIFQ